MEQTEACLEILSRTGGDEPWGSLSAWILELWEWRRRGKLDVPVAVDSLPFPRGTSSRSAIAMRPGDFASQRAVEGIGIQATVPGQIASSAHPAVAIAGSRARFESGALCLRGRGRGPGWCQSSGSGGFYRSLQGRREFGSHRALAVESHNFTGRGVQGSGPKNGGDFSIVSRS